MSSALEGIKRRDDGPMVAPYSSSRDRPGLLDSSSSLRCVQRFPQLVSLLEVQPEISCITKDRGQHHRGIRRDSATIGTWLIDGFSTHTHRFCQLSPGQSH